MWSPGSTTHCARMAPPTLLCRSCPLFRRPQRASPTLAEVRDAVRSIRAQKGMLMVPGDADCRSAGSFFKNPVVPVTVLDSLAQELGIEKRSIPAYPAQDGEVKLSAAWSSSGPAIRRVTRSATQESPAAIRSP